MDARKIFIALDSVSNRYKWLVENNEMTDIEKASFMRSMLQNKDERDYLAANLDIILKIMGR